MWSPEGVKQHLFGVSGASWAGFRFWVDFGAVHPPLLRASWPPSGAVGAPSGRQVAAQDTSGSMKKSYQK